MTNEIYILVEDAKVTRKTLKTCHQSVGNVRKLDTDKCILSFLSNKVPKELSGYKKYTKQEMREYIQTNYPDPDPES